MTGIICALTGGEFLAFAPESASGSGEGTVVTEAVSVTVRGGVAPFSYQWSTSVFGIVATDPDGSTTQFQLDDVVVPSSVSDNFFCTVTDSLGNDAVTNACLVSITGA